MAAQVAEDLETVTYAIPLMEKRRKTKQKNNHDSLCTVYSTKSAASLDWTNVPCEVAVLDANQPSPRSRPEKHVILLYTDDFFRVCLIFNLIKCGSMDSFLRVETKRLTEHLSASCRPSQLHEDLKGPRHLVSRIYRLRVNALRTKYCKDIGQR